VLTDWQRWAFGCFNDDGTHAWVSPIMHYNDQGPTILETLFYWAESSKRDVNSFNLKPKDVSGMPMLFPANPARRVSVSGRQGHVARDPNQVKTANESDVSVMCQEMVRRANVSRSRRATPSRRKWLRPCSSRQD
jgi:hypothetical protein